MKKKFAAAKSVQSTSQTKSPKQSKPSTPDPAAQKKQSSSASKSSSSTVSVQKKTSENSTSKPASVQATSTGPSTGAEKPATKDVTPKVTSPSNTVLNVRPTTSATTTTSIEKAAPGSLTSAGKPPINDASTKASTPTNTVVNVQPSKSVSKTTPAEDRKGEAKKSVESQCRSDTSSKLAPNTTLSDNKGNNKQTVSAKSHQPETQTKNADGEKKKNQKQSTIKPTVSEKAQDTANTQHAAQNISGESTPKTQLPAHIKVTASESKSGNNSDSQTKTVTNVNKTTNNSNSQAKLVTSTSNTSSNSKATPNVVSSNSKTTNTQTKTVENVNNTTTKSHSAKPVNEKPGSRSPSWSPDRQPKSPDPPPGGILDINEPVVLEPEDLELPDYEEYAANEPRPVPEMPAAESPVEDLLRSDSRQSGTREGSQAKSTASTSKHKHSKHKHKSKSKKRSRSKSPKRRSRSSSKTRRRSRSRSRPKKKVRSRSPMRHASSHRSKSPPKHQNMYNQPRASLSHTDGRSRSPTSSRSYEKDRGKDRDRDTRLYDKDRSYYDSRRNSSLEDRNYRSPPRDSRQTNFDSRQSNSSSSYHSRSPPRDNMYSSGQTTRPYNSGGADYRRRSRSPVRRDSHREGGELRSDSEYGRGGMRSDPQYQRGPAGGGMRSYQGRGGISDQIYGSHRSRSPTRYSGKSKQKKLRPRPLSPWSIDSLTFLVEKKWTAFYEKYYTPGQRDDILCLMFQREYLQAYRGFFQDDPHFDLSFPVLMKPEALRTELSERIDRGSPGPTSPDAGTYQPPTSTARGTPPPTAYDTIEPGELVDDDRRREIRRLRWERRMAEPAEPAPPRRVPSPPPQHYQQPLLDFKPKVSVDIQPHTSMMPSNSDPTSPSTPSIAEMHSFAKLKSLIREKLKIPTSESNVQPAPIDNIEVTDLVKEALLTIKSKEQEKNAATGYVSTNFIFACCINFMHTRCSISKRVSL